MPILPKKANTEGNDKGMDDRSPIPIGDYLSHIIKTEFKKTKAGDGHYLAVHEKILEGEYKGRMIFSNLNLDNPNAVAVEIANKTLNSICQACNVQGVENSDELLQIPHVITVGLTAATSQYPESNEILAYAPVDSANEDTPAFVEEEQAQVQVEKVLRNPTDPQAESKDKAAPQVEPQADKLPWDEE